MLLLRTVSRHFFFLLQKQVTGQKPLGSGWELFKALSVTLQETVWHWAGSLPFMAFNSSLLYYPRDLCYCFRRKIEKVQFSLLSPLPSCMFCCSHSVDSQSRPCLWHSINHLPPCLLCTPLDLLRMLHTNGCFPLLSSYRKFIIQKDANHCRTCNQPGRVSHIVTAIFLTGYFQRLG